MNGAPARPEPWPSESGCSGTHRSFVELATNGDSHASVRLTGSSRMARRTEILSHRRMEIWEVPVIGTDQQAELEVFSHGTLQRFRSQDGVGSGLGATSEAPDYGMGALALERLLGFHMERITHWSEGGEASNAATQADGMTQVSWPSFEQNYWRSNDATKEPPRHLIVRIAQECGDWITDLCERPRRILRRVRTLQPIAQAQDVDDACIRWLTRQPGRTMPERAGPRQRILAVAREDSVDTPENRVLRDFLRLSVQAATRYTRTYQQQFAESDRLTAVRRYLDAVQRLLGHSPIATVPSLVGEPTRNYVLQFDARYARMWTYYDRLRRQEDERDDLRAWRHRLWTEYCELLVRREIDAVLGFRRDGDKSFKEPAGRHVGPAVIRREADCGHFLDARTFPGLWQLGGSRNASSLRAHRTRALMQHPNRDVQQLSPLLPDLVLVESPTFEPHIARKIAGIWGLFAPADTDSDARERALRLHAALETHVARNTRALLILPAMDVRQAGDDLGSDRVACIRALLPDQPTPLGAGDSAMGKFLRSVLV